MTLEDFYDNLGIVYKEYMNALESAQNQFKIGIEGLMEDASKAFDEKYSGAIKASTRLQLVSGYSSYVRMGC